MTAHDVGARFSMLPELLRTPPAGPARAAMARASVGYSAGPTIENSHGLNDLAPSPAFLPTLAS